MARGTYLDSIRKSSVSAPKFSIEEPTVPSEDKGTPTKRNVEESFKGGIGNFAGASKFRSSVVDRIKYLEERDNSTNKE